MSQRGTRHAVVFNTQPDTSYNDAHRLYMQTMLSHRIVDEDKAVELWYRVCELTKVNRDNFAEFISTINHEISEVDLQLRRSQNERDGKPIIALVNTNGDAIAQFATNYTPSEILYIRQLFEMMVTADDEKFAVSSMVAIRLGQKMKPPLAQRETQDLLDRLISDGWVYSAQGGSYYTLDSRAVLELQTYLREQYGDLIRECLICFDVITMGERCQLENCSVRIHRHCADNYFRESSNMVCPTCTTRWSRSNTFGLGLPL